MMEINQVGEDQELKELELNEYIFFFLIIENKFFF